MSELDQEVDQLARILRKAAVEGRLPASRWPLMFLSIAQVLVDAGYRLVEPKRQPSITCPVCAATSYHPEDIRQGYCGQCHAFTTPKVVSAHE